MGYKFNPFTGNLDQTGSGGSPGGSDTYVQYNDASAFGGDAEFTWDETNDLLKAKNIRTGTLAVSGAGQAFAQPIVIGGYTPYMFIYHDTTYNIMRIGAQNTASSIAAIAFELPFNNNYQDVMSLSATSLVPASTFNNLINLGASGNEWKSLFIGAGGVSTFRNSIIVNENGLDADTRIEGDTDPDLFFVDASTDRVGIGTNTPAALLDVDGTARMTTLNIAGTNVTSSAVELNYSTGVTSAIQTQINAKMTNPMTTGGDVIYGGASGAPTRLTNGSAGQVLQSNGTTLAPTWVTVAGSGDMVLATAQTNSGIKTFLDTTMKLRNVANTFDGYFVNTNTANRIYTLKDAAGTLAFTSDITGTNSGTNTGDNTVSTSGAATTAVTLLNARTIGGVSFNGSANITVATATGGFTVSGGDLALGTNSITMSGSIGVTGTRITKGWFTDLQVTNNIAGGITGNAATVTTNANLTGHITSTGNAAVLGSFTSAQLLAALTNETGTGVAVFGTTPTIATPVLNGLPTGTGVASGATVSTLASRDANGNLSSVNLLEGYSTTATAAGTTTLTVGSTYTQIFTGATTQTVTMPVATTLVLGQQYYIVNNSTGLVTINSSGANAIIILAGLTSVIITCILTSGTTAASWSANYGGASGATGKKLLSNNTITLAGTDATTMTFPTTTATIARTDAAQTFTGTQTLGVLLGALDAGGATSLEVPNGAGGTTVDATGEVTIDSTSKTLNFYDGTAEVVVNPIQSKTLTIETPTASEDITMFHTDVAVTITKIVAVVKGSSTPSVTFNVVHGTDRSAAGTNLITSISATTNTTTGTSVTTFDNASVSAGAFIRCKTTAQSGTVTEGSITIFFKQNP